MVQSQCSGKKPVVGLSTTGAPRSGSRGGHNRVFAHAVAGRHNPDSVVDDPVHDHVGVDAAAGTLVPLHLLILGAENGRGLASTTFHQLQQHVPHQFSCPIQRPLVNHLESEGRITPRGLHGPAKGPSMVFVKQLSVGFLVPGSS